MKIVKCADCQAVFEIVTAPEQLPEGLTEVKAGEVDAALEKHVPVVTMDGHKMIVEVGSVAHPMTPAHYITAVWVEFEDGSYEKKALTPDMEPKVHFCMKHHTGKVTVYEYCNLHGLWKTDFVLE